MEKKFSPNYSFVKNEEAILRFWEQGQHFEKLREKNKNGKKYRFIDGPMTANNPMGIHHAWGRTLKDTFLRYKAMNGYTGHYRNGFDGQGLWVEVEVEKELGTKTKQDIEAYGLDKFTERCIERVKKYSGIITEQSKRLGQWMDWDNSYYTYTDGNITSIWAMLKICHDHGWIKQMYKPMPWCPRCGTSLSEHEMSGSYRELTHMAVFSRLPVAELDADILVWTTTPWTLTANAALAVHPELKYVRTRLQGEERDLIMGRKYYEGKFAAKGEILREYTGAELAGLSYETFFPELPLQQEVSHRIVPWKEVAEDEGCGVVHIAPGCGAEDFSLGLEQNLPVLIPIDEYGVLLPSIGRFAGKGAAAARDDIFAALREQGKLLYTHEIKHSYPVCWRCKTEVLFRCVKEWAIDVEELRPRLIAASNKVTWNPQYQGKRMLDWLQNMGDWNISRKRFYGLPLPFYLCECGELTVAGSIDELRALAADPAAVDALPHLHRPYIDGVTIRCPKCGETVTRTPEVGDVWLDAGIVPFSTLKYFEDRDYWRAYFPAEYVVEMKEQVRLWFYSMLFMSVVLIDEPPFEQVGTHGMVTAEDGGRFSKTGHMIQFHEAADIIGADASRYLYAAAPMTGDVRFGFTLGDEAKRKLLGYWNLSTFFATYAEIDHPRVPTEPPRGDKLNVTDRWLLALVDSFTAKATQAYESYSVKDVVAEFERVVDAISNFYIRVNRRRFWKDDASDDKDRAYAMMMYAIRTLTQVMAPILPFITEHIWQEVVLRWSTETAESVHLSDWPQVPALSEEAERSLSEVADARAIISLALSARNDAKLRIRQPLNTLYFLKKSGAAGLDSQLESIVLSEINVKSLQVIESAGAIECYRAALNFKQAGAVLRGDVNRVKELVMALDDASMDTLVDAIRQGGEISIPGYDTPVPAAIFELNAFPKPGIVPAEDAAFLIGLDTALTPELEEEGHLRDILRQCQVFRKEAGYDVSDRVRVAFDSAETAPMLTRHRAFIEAELLATVCETLDKPDFIGEVSLVDGRLVSVSLKK